MFFSNEQDAKWHDVRHDPDFEKVDQLYDWVSNTGQGIMGFTQDEVPDECFQFCLDQYARFKVPMNSKVAGVVMTGAWASFYHVDSCDPYALFNGCAGVELTHDWAAYAYEVQDEVTGQWREISPEWLETFKFVPGLQEKIFDYHMSHPGLEALHGDCGYMIDDMILGNFNNEEVHDALDTDTDLALRELCTINGAFDEKRFEAYFKLAAWAGFTWIAGPPGVRFLMQSNEIYAVARNFGECILADGCVFPPTHYRKLDRAPRTCHRCGVGGWCVELTMSGSSVTQICNHCASEGMPTLPGPMCGAKFCKNSKCPHHPYHRLGESGGLHASVRSHGQMIAMARAGSQPYVIGAPNNPPNSRLLRG